MLNLPIEYLVLVAIVSIIGAFFVGTTAYGVLVTPLCPSEQPDCSADTIFARAVGSILAVVIFVFIFWNLIYYLVRRGKRTKRMYEHTPFYPKEQKGKVRFFTGDTWLKEVSIIIAANFATTALVKGSLPFYITLPLSIVAMYIPIIIIRKKSLDLFKGQNWQSELCIVILWMVIANLLLRNLIGYPISILAETGIVLLAVWLIRRNSIKSLSNEQPSINEHV